MADIKVSRGSALRRRCRLVGEDGEGVDMRNVTLLELSVKVSTDDPDADKIIEIDHSGFIDPEDDAEHGIWYMRVPGPGNNETPGVYFHQWEARGLPVPLEDPFKFPETPEKYIITPTCDLDA